MKYIVTLNGKEYEVEVEQGIVAIEGIKDAPVVEQVAPQPVAAPPAQPAEPAPVAPAPVAASTAGGEPVAAPMPGTILKISAKVGDQVAAGDILLTLEAMKMENEIVAPVAGKVVAINVAVGSSVSTGDVMAVVG